MKWLSVLLLAFACTLLAADISGTWKGTAEGPNGPIERTFVFKVDGNKLTGETTSQLMGKSTITDGKIDGDTLSFTVNAKYQDNDMKLMYKGKINGDQIELKMESDQGFSLEYVIKRVS